MSFIRQYRIFDLAIEPTPNNYQVSILNSPSGQASGEFQVPRAVKDFVLTSESTSEIEVGRQLFAALFHGVVGEQLRASLVSVGDETGLRINLRVNDSFELATLPWELLYDTTHNRFLALSERTPINRYLALPLAEKQLNVEPPLRVLALFSAPENAQSQLNVEEEWGRLQKALAPLVERGTIVLRRLEHATWEELQRTLRTEATHILHFVGQGYFDAVTGMGQLLFEDADRQQHLVSAARLSQLLHNHPALRLAFLNTCEGAAFSPRNTFAGVAQSLVQQGVPAVVAMQQAISAQAAQLLAQSFYEAVADDYPVDAALAQARLAIYAESNIEWAMPILFMRATDSLFLTTTQTVEPEPVVPGTYNASLLPHLADELADLICRNRSAEIKQILSSLNTSVLTTITGLGGVGKTTLARVTIEERPQDIPQPLWIDLHHESDLSLDDFLAKFADYLQWPELLQFKKDNRPADRSDLVRLTGKLHESKPLWIVFDNLESILDEDGRFLNQGMADLFTTLVERTHNAHILVTSRLLPHLPDQRPADQTMRGPTVALKGLSQDEGLELLRNYFQLSDQSGLGQIVTRVGGHPLALHALASEIRTWGVSELLESQESWQESIESFAGWLFNRLTQTEQQLLARFSVFRRPQPFAVLASLSPDRRTARTTIRWLLDRSLLESYDVRGVRLFSLHPLVSELTQGYLLYDERKRAHLAALDVYVQVELLPSVQWQGTDDILPLLEGFHHAIEAEEVRWAAAIMLENGLPDLLEQWGTHDRLIRMSQQLIGAAPEGMPLDEYLHQKGYQALQQEELAPAQRAFIYRQLGRCARYLSLFPIAVAIYQQGITLLEGDPDNRELARLYRGSADVLNLLGEPDRSLRHSRAGLALLAEASDKQGLADKANLHMSSGNGLFYMGKSEDALSEFEQAHRIFLQIGMLSRAYQAYDNMAAVLSYLGEANGESNYIHEALSFHERALDYFRSVQHLHSIAAATLNIASQYHLLGDFHTAYSAYEEARKLFEEIDHHQGSLLAQYNLGELTLDEGKPEQALAHLESALQLSITSGETVEQPYILFLLSKTEFELGLLSDSEIHAMQALMLIEGSEHSLSTELRRFLEAFTSREKKEKKDDKAV